MGHIGSLFTSLAFVLASSGCASRPIPQPADLTELVGSPGQFDAKIVSVRACLAASPHGSYLFNCNSSDKAILVVLPSDNDKTYWQAYTLSQEQILSQVSATFVGRFSAMKNIESFGEVLPTKILAVEQTSGIAVDEP